DTAAPAVDTGAPATAADTTSTTADPATETPPPETPPETPTATEPTTETTDPGAGGATATLAPAAKTVGAAPAPLSGSLFNITYLNGDLSTTLTVRATPGGVIVPLLTQAQLDELGFAYPADKYFENTWEYVPGGQPVDFSNDVVASDLTLRPILRDGVTISFSTGTPDPPAPVKALKGSTLADVVLPLASSVTRSGYIAKHWSLPGLTEPADFDYVLDADVTLELQWAKLAGGVPYEIVYWVEKPSLGVNFSPKPGNAAHYDQAYEVELGGMGTAGDLVGGPGIEADIEITSIPAPSFFDLEDPMHWAQWQFTEPTTLRGDGLSVVNVYCTLRTYRVSFEIDPLGETGRTMSGDPDHNGSPTTYTYDNPYFIDFKFGDHVAERWPHPTTGWTFDNPDGSQYSYWAHGDLAVASGDWQTPRTDITAAMMPSNPSGRGYTVSMVWTNVTDTVTMNYWGEQLPEQAADASLTRRQWNGLTWVLLGDYTAVVPVTTDFQSKAIPGFLAGVQGDFSDEISTGSFATVQRADGTHHNYVNHYYQRRVNPLTFNNMGHGTAPAAVNLPYGASLAPYETTLPDETGWHFKGWYVDAAGTLEFSFGGTMGADDLTVFAKWESTDHTVTFLDSDGTPLADDGSQLQGVQNGHTVNFVSLTIGGQRYVAKETNDANRGALVGWDWKPTPTSPKKAFDPDTELLGDLTLYARWQTTGLTIDYHQLDGRVIYTEDSGGGGFNNGVLVAVRDGAGVECPDQSTFLGWRIDGSGAVYVPGAPYRIAGNPHFYPFCPETGADLHDVTYVSNGDYIVSFLDGYGAVVYTEQVAPGERPPLPTTSQLAAAGFAIPAKTVFEGEWTLASNPGPVYDFSAPVEANLVLKPVLRDTVTIYFETSGTSLDPIDVKKGSTLGSLSLPDMRSVVRPGYNPLYWTLDDPKRESRDPISPDYAVDADTTLYLIWEAVANATPYHVVFWVERPNLGANTTPTPGDPTQYVLGYAEPNPRYATAGQSVGSGGQDVVIDSLPSPSPFDSTDAMRYAQWQATESNTISGDGDTIVNVYCQLRVYYFRFMTTTTSQMDFDFDGDGAMEHYDSSVRLDLPYKFGQRFGKTWPHPDNGAVFTFSNRPNYRFDAWKSPKDVLTVSSSIMWSTPRVTAVADMMPSDPERRDVINITMAAPVTSSLVNIRYWAEATPEQGADDTSREYGGQRWYLLPAMNATMSANSSYLAKEIEGMLVVADASGAAVREFSETETGPATATGGYVNFYYTRNTVRLSYDTRGHGSVATAVLKYGYGLAPYDVEPPEEPS
ncbi:MAG: InlB B-repeat-containing protein, partial [Propionibacteriaceae bacterium]|nr:InlB B-repeat-containing protein [Propionibacteriaceae bacterium]